MKMMSFIVLICFSFNVLASTGTVKELEKSFDNYQYAMTVEWDQKDMKFQEAQTNLFFQKIGSLVKSGLTTEEMEAFIEAKITNKEALAALQLKMNLLSQANTPEELAQILRENSQDMYSRGASWNGDIVLWVGGLAVVALIGYVVWFEVTHKCVAWGQAYVCDTYGGSPQYGGYNTYCGYRSVCTEYEKK